MKKWIMTLSAALLCAVMLGSCVAEDIAGSAVFMTLILLGDDRAPYDDIIAYVEENQDLLEACIDKGDYQPTVDSSVVKNVIEWNNGAIDFYCGGAGIGAGTVYRGFYYSEADDLRAVHCPADCELTPYDKGWRYEQAYGDNITYIEPIIGHFYYYEASY